MYDAFANILVPLLVALITSPFIAYLVTVVLNRSLDKPVLTITALAMSLQFQVDDVELGTFNEKQLSIFKMALYDFGFTQTDVRCEIDFVNIITDLYKSFVELNYDDCVNTKQSFHKMFTEALKVKRTIHFNIVLKTIICASMSLVNLIQVYNRKIHNI